jgi:hypothetical protein
MIGQRRVRIRFTLHDHQFQGYVCEMTKHLPKNVIIRVNEQLKLKKFLYLKTRVSPPHDHHPSPQSIMTDFGYVYKKIKV